MRTVMTYRISINMRLETIPTRLMTFLRPMKIFSRATRTKAPSLMVGISTHISNQRRRKRDLTPDFQAIRLQKFQSLLALCLLCPSAASLHIGKEIWTQSLSAPRVVSQVSKWKPSCRQRRWYRHTSLQDTTGSKLNTQEDYARRTKVPTAWISD